MKNETFVPVKGYEKKYLISNMGRVKNVISGKFLVPYVNKKLNGYTTVRLSKKNVESNKALGKLVLQHFELHEINKDFALHLDLSHINNKLTNLRWASRGDIFRYYYTMKKKQRGVYTYPIGKKNFRAVLKVDDRPVTIGYYKTHQEAADAFKKAYEATYGYTPY